MKRFKKNSSFLSFLFIILYFLSVLLLFSVLYSCASSDKQVTEEKNKPETNVKIIIVRPINNEKVYKKIKVKFFIQNLKLPIAETRLYIDNNIISIKKEGDLVFETDINFLEDKKEYKLSVSVLDTEGNEYRSDPINIIVDSDVPQLILKDDIEQKTINTKEIIDKEVIAKNELSKIEIYIDGKLYDTVTDVDSDIVIDPEKIGQGEHTVYFKIYDKKNNIKTTPISKFMVSLKSDKTANAQKAESQTEKNNDTKNTKEQEEKTQNIISLGKIVYPQNYKGELADYLTVIVQDSKGNYLEITKDIEFKNIIAKVKVEESSKIEFKNITKTDVYFLRLNNGKTYTNPYIIGFIKNNLVKIDSVSYFMGNDNGVFDSEKPEHKVTLSSFYISKYEVSKKEFEVFLKVSGYKPTYRFKTFSKSEYNLPITNITWYDAKSFCSWLGVRLPYEAEWEYVAKTSKNYAYSWGNEGLKGNLKGNKDGYVSLAPVNAFDPNELGIYNLSGNVWEWCEDWYSPSYYSISPEKDPKGPSFGTSKVIRGGSYKDNIVYLRTTARGAINPYSTLDNVGFRIAKDAE